MKYSNELYELLAVEYSKIKCPVCGKSPELEVSSYNKFYTHSCGHGEVELLIQQADQRCVALLYSDTSRTIRLVPPPKE